MDALTMSRRPAEADGKGRFAPIEPASLASQVADRLVEAIAAGRIAPGARIFETEIAAGLGVSRVPVREALRLLEGQGLLVARHHRGIRVIELDSAWAAQLYELRVAIERLALRHAVARYREQPERLKALDAAVARMREAAAAGDGNAVNVADLAFHEAVCVETGSPLLMTMWRTIRCHVRILFARETHRAVDLDRIVAQHLRLRALLAAGDLPGLEREIEEHVAGQPWPAGGREGPRAGGAGRRQGQRRKR
ncbi:MAG: GntR family transcriptional regulator [Rhodospirillaceae bacterium]|nr:GntR family transcriptional regulator [Rhodospirillaceae bacterium]